MTTLFEKKLPEFLGYLLDVRGGSEASVKTYQGVLEKALPMIEVREEKGRWIIDLTPYRIHIAGQHKKTIAKKVSALRSFFDWCKEIGIPLRLKGDTQVKVPKSLPKPVSNRHITEVLEKASGEQRIIILLLYGLGLRISELSGLKMSHIRGEWVEVTGKGNKTRMVPLLPQVRRELELYLQNTNPAHFVLEEKGKKLSDDQLRYRVRTMFESIGLHITPHQLRHAFATDLLNHGAQITEVSEILGHAALSTTEIYTKISSSLKMKNYLAAHPLCKDDNES